MAGSAADSAMKCSGSGWSARSSLSCRVALAAWAGEPATGGSGPVSASASRRTFASRAAGVGSGIGAAMGRIGRSESRSPAVVVHRCQRPPGEHEGPVRGPVDVAATPGRRDQPLAVLAAAGIPAHGRRVDPVCGEPPVDRLTEHHEVTVRPAGPSAPRLVDDALALVQDGAGKHEDLLDRQVGLAGQRLRVSPARTRVWISRGLIVAASAVSAAAAGVLARRSSSRIRLNFSSPSTVATTT